MAKKETNKELVAKANNAFTIASELTSVINSIVEADGECSDETFAELQKWQGALEIKAENIGFAKIQLEKEAEYFRAVEEAAVARRKAREKAVVRLKKYLKTIMEAAGKTSIKKGDGLFSFSLTKGRAKVLITDEKKLPFHLVDIVEVFKPKTSEIKKELENLETENAGVKEGEELKTIPGARLEFGESYVTIRGGK